MATGNSEEMDAATRDRDFTQRNDDNGWSYPLIFYDSPDTGQPRTKKAKKGPTNGKRTIFVDRHGLANYSPVFKRIFFDTNFVDASKPELVMTGRNYDDFLEFISCVAITHKSDRKPVGMDNLELLLRFADEFAIGSLKERCVAFISQLTPTLGINDHGQRQILGRLFVICHRTDNTTLLPADIATKKISRFPYDEIEALDVNEQTMSELLKTKLKRYSRLYCAAKEPPEKCEFGFVSRCAVCQCDVGGNIACFYCTSCSNVWKSPDYDYCSACFDAHHVHAHEAGAHVCPDCSYVFEISDDDCPDRCGCN